MGRFNDLNFHFYQHKTSLNSLSTELEKSKGMYYSTSSRTPPFYWSINSKEEPVLHAKSESFMSVSIEQRNDGSFYIDIQDMNKTETHSVAAPVRSLDINVHQDSPSTVDIHMFSFQRRKLYTEYKRHPAVMRVIFSALQDRMSWYKNDKDGFIRERRHAWNKSIQDGTDITADIFDFIVFSYIPTILDTEEAAMFQQAINTEELGSLRSIARLKAIEDVLASNRPRQINVVEPVSKQIVSELKQKLDEAGFETTGRHSQRIQSNQQTLVDQIEYRQELLEIWQWLTKKALNTADREQIKRIYGEYCAEIQSDAIYQALAYIRTEKK